MEYYSIIKKESKMSFTAVWIDLAEKLMLLNCGVGEDS